jgi:hypothetical protein
MENPDSLRHEDGPGQVWSAYSVHSLGFQKGINREPEGVGIVRGGCALSGGCATSFRYLCSTISTETPGLRTIRKLTDQLATPGQITFPAPITLETRIGDDAPLEKPLP